MTIKEKIKSEIDKIPDELAERVYKLINSENKKKSLTQKIKQSLNPTIWEKS